MKSWRRPWQATGDKSNVGHPAGASRFIRVIPPSATPSTGHRTPLHRHRFATPYGLRSAAASPQPQGPNRPKRNYMAVLGCSRSYIDEDAIDRPPPTMKAPPPSIGAADEMPDSARDLLTAEEVASVLRVTPAWVYAQTRRRRIPHLRLGRYVRYRREALDEWIEQVESSSSSPPGRRGDSSRRTLR